MEKEKGKGEACHTLGQQWRAADEEETRHSIAARATDGGSRANWRLVARSCVSELTAVICQDHVSCNLVAIILS